LKASLQAWIAYAPTGLARTAILPDSAADIRDELENLPAP